MKRWMVIGLCEGRHDLPRGVNTYVFKRYVDLNNLKGIDIIADRVACQAKCDDVGIRLYLNGVQIPLLAMVNACIKRNVPLVCMHWNPVDKIYVAQAINTTTNNDKEVVNE